MALLHLALTDHAAVARRDAISALMDGIDGADGRTDMTREDADTLSHLAAAWASIHTTVRETCETCGRAHDALWTVRRVPADTLGPWIVYRVNGAGRTFPGGGLPMTLDKLPRDAVRVTPAAMAAFWHAD